MLVCFAKKKLPLFLCFYVRMMLMTMDRIVREEGSQQKRCDDVENSKE